MSIILDEIVALCDNQYKEFSKKLIPGCDNILGLRAPFARAIAKKYANTPIGSEFLSALPHKYHDENMVHAYMLGMQKDDTEKSKKMLIDFLPYVTNWAVCDSLCMSLKRFFKKPELVYDFVLECLKSDKTYTVRFGLVSLLDYYVDKKHIDDLIRISTNIKSEEYYINMALAWLLSVMLVKEYENTVVIFEKRLLPKWVHNKAIQKAKESYRINKEKKEYLCELRYN
ncbi:MAG: DNA alkylation repair protein [Clostridia bacterium]|nr:DNA alkylation repair protein [Clostridia bacterium]